MSNRNLKIEPNEARIKNFADEFGIELSALKNLINNKKKSGKKGPWPLRHKWCREDKELQKKFKRYKYLVPLLNQLKDHRAISQERNKTLGIEPFKEFGVEKEYVLLDLSGSRKRIADEIGCSETTLRHYVRGLVECGLMKYFHKGKAGRFYSMATWGIMPSDVDKNEFVDRKIMWLTSQTSNRLRKFKPVRQK